MRMSLKMENFCRAYVLGGVAKTAALEAGYSDSYARCRSHELLDHMGVRMGIEQLRWEMREHNSWEPDAGGGFSYDEPRWRQRYLEVLWAVGSASMEEMIVDGEMVEPEPGALAWWAIKSWKKVPDGKGGMTPQIELHNRMPALREFGKATGFNVPLALQPTGKMAWKGPFSPFGAASMKDAFDPPGWSDMEKAAAATAGGAASQGVGEPTDKNRGFGPMFSEMVAGEATDKNRAFAPMFQEMGDGGATDKNRSFGGGSDRGIAEFGTDQPTDKNRAFAPMLEEMGAGEATDKYRAFEGGSDRGIAIGAGLVFMPPLGLMPAGTPAFPTGAIAARPKGRTPTGAAAPQGSRGACLSGMEDGASCSELSFTILELEAPATPRTPVVSSWTEQVAILRSEPVEVLERLVLAILNDPTWSGRRLSADQKGEMLAELVHAVPLEVAMKLVKRLEEESGVTVIHG